MIIFLKRIIKSGWLGFKRQANLSFATCLILVMTVSLISFLFLFRDILGFLAEEARAKADVSVYFKEDCAEEKMFEIKEELAELEAVKEIELISKEEALEDFIERHRDEESLMESLVELGANPFLASLNIKASEIGDYEKIASFLEEEEFEEVIEKVDYHKRKPVIERIFEATNFADKTGIVILTIFVLVSVLLSFNTIRLAISGQKEEISIMRLVGASNNFIRGPFLVQGAICGIISLFVSLTIVSLSSYIVTPQIAGFFPGFRFFDFFKLDFGRLFLIQIVFSLGLGIIPSFIAIRRFLRV